MQVTAFLILCKTSEKRTPVKSQTLLIGVSGGSGSGKTTFARKLQEGLGAERSAILSQDSYYIDQSSRFTGDGSVNFDHPSALDFALLADHLRALKAGSGVEVPIYDFVTHSRKPTTHRFDWKPIVVVDGTLLLSQPQLLPLLDWKLFIDTSEAIRFDRRFKRDLVERGRQPEGIRTQFFQQVKPMHDEFIEPSKPLATEVISGEVGLEESVQKILDRLR
jgi:uridine kinase